MLSREQSLTLFMLNNRRWENNNPMGWLPRELATYIMNIGYDQDPNSEIAIALSLAASGQENDLVVLADMINANPRLLLKAGDVVTRGGFHARRKTLYAFFLGEGDPVGAKRIEFGFADIPDGDKVRLCQYEEYRPHLEVLAKQIESKSPAYDLKPLFDTIIDSSYTDITEALNKNFDYPSKLNTALDAFRKAVTLKTDTVGMHYQHYTTLMQAFDLRTERWQALSNNSSNYDKCTLVWRQIIGRLQLNLPAVDRFAFARAFDDEKRTVNYKYAGAFPDALAQADLVSSGVGFDKAIYGVAARWGARHRHAAGCAVPRCWKKHIEKKFKLAELMQSEPRNQSQFCIMF